MRPVAPASSGPVCHQIQQQTTTVCLTGPRPPGMGSGCTQPILGGPGPIRLPTGSHLGQSGGEAPGLPLQQNNSDCPRVAQHALVLGSSSNVKSDPTVSAQHTQLSVSAIQPGPSQEPVESEPTCLAPRVPKSLHPHLRWWLEESNVLLGQPLNPLKHALQIFTDASKEGRGAHLDEHTARRTLSLP